MQVADALRGNDGVSSSSSVERPSDIAKLTRRVEAEEEAVEASRSQGWMDVQSRCEIIKCV